ncbi:Pentatricopeptide repeat-containing protein, chloroplastic [Sesamum alatum]|uniref:Pentatricopeptide repeat-containing protein, chloroplastic n=1 Tax=Sesamum alatum TaxID=300844 RepID=A0AAE1Z387_9LAMI|nr:Pentatricopeptide repeat-containing protein, chloroplastic [Sesamum alatum]
MSNPAFTAAPITIQQLSSPPSAPPFRLSPINTSSPDRRQFSLKTSQSNNSNSLLEASTASWTSSIAHHCKSGRLSKAVLQFSSMRTSGVEPNHVTFVTLLSGCADFPSQGLSLGPSVHGYARKMGLDVDNVMVGTALIVMYSKFGEMGLARLSFDHMGIKNKEAYECY